MKKRAKIAGVVAIPFAGGLSSAVVVAGLMIGTLTISTAELAIICDSYNYRRL